MQNHSPFIRVENLSKTYSYSYGEVHSLKLVHFTIYLGESVAIMGPSGSGKSTLLHLLGCLETPTEGHYFFNNRDVSSLSDGELSLIRAQNIGFIFQAFHLVSQLSVYENVELPFLYHSRSFENKVIRERVLNAIECVKLQHRMNHLPSQLSGGEMQRVAIARALAIHPLLILADEPTGNLDSETGGSILELLQELNRQGTTLVVVTHDEKVAACCQRVLKMRDGRMIW